MVEDFAALEERSNLEKILSKHEKDVSNISYQASNIGFISSGGDNDELIRFSSVILANSDLIKDVELQAWINKCQWVFQNNPVEIAWPTGNFIKEFFM